MYALHISIIYDTSVDIVLVLVRQAPPGTGITNAEYKLAMYNTHLPQTAQDASNIRYMAHAERAELARCPTGAWYGLPSDPLYVQAAWHGTIDFFGASTVQEQNHA